MFIYYNQFKMKLLNRMFLSEIEKLNKKTFPFKTFFVRKFDKNE
jgi:hypothetical protein